MSDLHTHGRIVWHDLMSNDRAASVAFFTKLIGWKTRGEDPKSADYVHFVNGETDLAGSPIHKDPNSPPHWLTYVTVDDVDASAERVKKLGGRVYAGPMQIEKVGKMAVIGDPTGGVLALFRQDKGEDPEPQGRPANGTFCWNELASTDPEKAAAFYGEVFGWSFDAKDMGPMGVYRVAMRNGQMIGGIMQSPMPGHSYWLNYIAVADVDAKTKEATGLGAKVVTGPMDIPNMGRFSILQDPTGVFFALFAG